MAAALRAVNTTPRATDMVVGAVLEAAEAGVVMRTLGTEVGVVKRTPEAGVGVEATAKRTPVAEVGVEATVRTTLLQAEDRAAAEDVDGAGAEALVVVVVDASVEAATAMATMPMDRTALPVNSSKTPIPSQAQTTGIPLKCQLLMKLKMWSLNRRNQKNRLHQGLPLKIKITKKRRTMK